MHVPEAWERNFNFKFFLQVQGHRKAFCLKIIVQVQGHKGKMVIEKNLSPAVQLHNKRIYKKILSSGV